MDDVWHDDELAGRPKRRTCAEALTMNMETLVSLLDDSRHRQVCLRAVDGEVLSSLPIYNQQQQMEQTHTQQTSKVSKEAEEGPLEIHSLKNHGCVEKIVFGRSDVGHQADARGVLGSGL